MKLKISKKFKIIFLSTLGVLALCVPFVLLGVSLSSSSRDFIFGNFGSYMSPEVEKNLTNRYNVAFDTYETADQIANNLKKDNMDLVVSTSYESIALKNEGLLKKIDWSSFNIKDSNGALITDSTKALSLFSQDVREIVNPMNETYNLLDYGIPYFIQDLVFIYRGKEITKLRDDHNPTWKQIFEVISEESRFNPQTSNSLLPKIGLIDDNRTIFSLSKLIETDAQVNPEPNKNSINELANTYSKLSGYFSHFGNNSILFNDSNTLLNQIAKSQLNGTVMYNGDGIFASLGGDLSPNENVVDFVNIDDFHVVKPKNTLVALDMININTKLDGNNLDKAYKMINELALSFDQNDPENSLIYQNFDYVGYTPTLESLYNYVFDEYFLDDPLETKQKKLLTINFSGFEFVEAPIDNLIKSNLFFAYISFKSSL